VAFASLAAAAATIGQQVERLADLVFVHDGNSGKIKLYQLAAPDTKQTGWYRHVG
jgi:hypothetical protein